MVPSSFMISQITPAGRRPANLERSTDPSVCPVRTRTPPRLARNGKMWPGLTMSLGATSGATATWMVLARSAAEIPVVTPSRASMLTVNAVWKGDLLSRTIIGSCSLSINSGVRVRQTSPRPYFAIKLIASGVTICAAMHRSPSFSRSSSSTRMTIFPDRISSITSLILFTGIFYHHCHLRLFHEAVFR